MGCAPGTVKSLTSKALTAVRRVEGMQVTEEVADGSSTSRPTSTLQPVLDPAFAERTDGDFTPFRQEDHSRSSSSPVPGGAGTGSTLTIVPTMRS